jgi:hypothetical protein
MNADVCTIIGVNVGLFGACFALIAWTLNKIDADVKDVGARVDKLGQRVDNLGVRLDGHATRIDQLYRMFVDLLKERK